MSLPFTTGVSFDRWAAEVALQLEDIGVPFITPPPEDQWREWVERLAEYDELDVPDVDEGFASWREWADRFIELNFDVVTG